MNDTPDNFDPNALASAQFEGEFESPPPIPEGEYLATVENLLDPPIKRVIPHDTNKPPVHFLGLLFRLDVDADTLTQLKRGAALVRGEFRVNLNGSGVFDKVNPALKNLREAFGQTSGPWSPTQLVGAGPVKVLVTHRQADDGRVFEEIRKVRKPD